MSTYTFTMPVLLALHDYVPVIFSAVGLCLLAMMGRQIHRAAGWMMTIGFVLIVAGGVLKATYKLDAATLGIAPRWWDRGMFAWMGAGFTLIAIGMWNAVRVRAGKLTLSPIWALPALVIALHYGAALYLGLSNPGTRTWSFLLLGLTTIGNFVLGGLAVSMSFREGLKLAGALFIVNLVMILMLQGMARLDQDSLMLQGTQQVLNMFSQGAFAFAAWKLHDQTVTASEGAASAAEPQAMTAR